MKLSRLISSSCSLICKEIEKYIKKENDKLKEELEKAGYLDIAYTLSVAEEIEEKLSKILQGKTDKFILLLNENPNATISEIIDMLPNFNADSSVVNDINLMFKDEFEKSVPKISNTYIQSIDKELELKKMTNRTSDWIESWSEDLSKIMEVTSEEQLNNTLSVALKEGKSVTTVAEELTDSSIVTSAKRARTTAITEMLRANSVSAQEAYIQSPAVSQKKWRHTGARKNNPRSNHVNINGQIVNINEPFELIGADGTTYYPMYPRDTILPPSESVNCHCIHQPIVDKEIIGLSIEEREKLQKNCINDDNKAWKKAQKEQGISEKKKEKNKNNSVDLNYIKSKEYKEKFNGITGNKKVDNRIYSQSKAMLTHRNGTDKEDMCLINSVTGKIEGKQTSSKTDFGVDYNDSLNEAIDNNSEYSLIAVHNHPTNNPPTGSDIISAGGHKYKMGVVVTHDGRVFTYKAGDIPFSENAFAKRVDKYRSSEYNLSESNAILQTLQDFKNTHGIDWSER